MAVNTWLQSPKFEIADFSNLPKESEPGAQRDYKKSYLSWPKSPWLLVACADKSLSQMVCQYWKAFKYVAADLVQYTGLVRTVF